MALALASGQPYRTEVCTWDDREVDTAWDLLREVRRKTESPGRGDPGAGGPQYSG